jgi:Bacterial Ig domain/Right handed beta helix region
MKEHKMMLRSLLAITVFGTLSTVARAQGPNLDLRINDEGAYQAFKGAMFKSEYVRVDYSLDPNPRAVAVATGLQIFATNNPLATNAELQSFVNTYDGVLGEFAPGDPNLSRTSNFLAAVRLHDRLAPSGPLAGLDTRVGGRVLELLGVQVPAPAEFAATAQRMVEFDNARFRSFTNSPAWHQVLLLGFYGQDLAGHANEAISGVLEGYLATEGFEPVPDWVGDSHLVPARDALLTMPPNYGAFRALLDQIAPQATNLDDTSLQNAIQNHFLRIRTENANLVNEIRNDMKSPPSVAEAANNALNQSTVNQVVAEYEDDLIAVSDERATASWNTMILLQSDQAEARNYATSANKFLAAQLETDDTLAKVKLGIEIAGGLGTIAVGVAKGEPSDVIGGTTTVLTNSLDLADAFGAFDNPPPPEEQIFQQIVQVRMDIDNMRVEMHDRFDSVEAQLNTVFESMIAGFEGIEGLLQQQGLTLDELVRGMAEVRATLDRIEEALWGFGQAALLADLALLTDLYLDFRRNGADFPYSGIDTNFVEAMVSLKTFATVNSAFPQFAGLEPSPLTSFDVALGVLTGDSIGRNVNDLRVFPTTMNPPLPPLLGNRVVAAAPWSQSASAYTQLAAESPWYFAFQYENQVENGGVVDLHRIIESGEDLVTMMFNGHDRRLFDGLFHSYRGQEVSIAFREVDSIRATQVAEGLTSVDPFGGLTQPSVGVDLPRIAFMRGVGAINDHLEMPDDGPTGWNILQVGNHQRDIAELKMALVGAAATQAVQTDFRWNMLPNPESADNEAFLNFQFRINGGPGLEGFTVRQLQITFWNLGSPLNLGTQAQTERMLADDLVFWRRVRAHLVTDQNLTGTSFTELNGDGDSITIQVVSDRLWPFDTSGRTLVLQLLEDFQVKCWQRAGTDPPMIAAANRLLDYEALLDAYVTLSMPDLMESSTVALSAFRGVPSVDSLSLAVDVIGHYQRNVNDPANATHIVDRFASNRQMAQQTVNNWLAQPPSRHGYLDWMLSELYELQDNALRLAIDDRYETTGELGELVVTAEQGLLANDVDQEFRTPEIASYTQPSSGSVAVALDGSFIYTPEHNFLGTTSFTYTTRAEILTIEGDPQYFETEPATVVLVIAIELQSFVRVPEDCPTIQRAISIILDNPASVIEIAPGTYHENIDFNGKAVTLRSASGDPADTIIDGGGAGSVITCNSAEGPGTLLEGLTITNGHAPRGAGINIGSANVAVRNCWINNNTCWDFGCAASVEDGILSMTNCRVENNATTEPLSCCPGVLYQPGDGILTNCVFAGNTGTFGAVAIAEGTVDITNCTIANNVSPTDTTAGGLESAGTVNIANTIIYGNVSGGNTGQDAQVLDIGATPSLTLGYSLVQGLTGSLGGTGNIGADPVFVDAVGGDLRLAPGSPCIDAGDNTTPGLVGITTDQLSHARFFDDPTTPDTGNGVAPLVDMGAYEYTTGDADGDGVADLFDYEMFAGCVTGADGPVPADCILLDMDADGDVDLLDFGVLQLVFDGS